MRLIEKKKKDGKELSEVEGKAKETVLSDLKDMAGKAMSDKLNGLKKVSVASDSEEGLKKGLDKAKDIVEKMPEVKAESEEGDSTGGSLEPSEELGESNEEAIKKEHEMMSLSEIEEEIKKLQELKRAKTPINKPY